MVFRATAGDGRRRESNGAGAQKRTCNFDIPPEKPAVTETGPAAEMAWLAALPVVKDEGSCNERGGHVSGNQADRCRRRGHDGQWHRPGLRRRRISRRPARHCAKRARSWHERDQEKPRPARFARKTQSRRRRSGFGRVTATTNGSPGRVRSGRRSGAGEIRDQEGGDGRSRPRLPASTPFWRPTPRRFPSPKSPRRQNRPAA